MRHQEQVATGGGRRLLETFLKIKKVDLENTTMTGKTEKASDHWVSNVVLVNAMFGEGVATGNGDDSLQHWPRSFLNTFPQPGFFFLLNFRCVF